MASFDSLFDIKTIYFESKAIATEVGHSILSRFPDVEYKEIQSHWKIPQLNLDPKSIASWTSVKRNSLVLGTKKKLYVRDNGRSTNFIAPSHSNGCTAACNYCYVARRKGYANPITIFTNNAEAVDFTARHSAELAPKQVPDQCDPYY